AAIREEARFVGVSVETNGLDLPHSARPQSLGDIAFKIELPAPFPRGLKKRFVRRRKVSAESGIDLVAALRDARADGGNDARACRPQALHGLDSVLDHPSVCTAPARMSGTDHTCGQVGEQDRCAIGCNDAE